MSRKKLRLVCLVWPDDKPGEHSVEVKINKNESVAALKDMVKDKHAHVHAFAHIGARNLVLWKCSIPVDDNLQETLNTVRFDGTDARLHHMSPTSMISQYFVTVLPHETIHILVELPALKNDTLLSPLPNLSNLREERRRFDATFPGKPPSSHAVPSEFSKLQQKQGQKLVWSRPPGADATIPVTLLHPIFRQFIDDCENHQPIQSDNELVLELMAVMSTFFLDKNARAAELRDILTTHGILVDTSTITSKGHHFLTDGSVVVNGHLVAIIKVKGEICSKGAEPYAEVNLYYTHSTLTKAQGFSKFNFPALLITVFGPQISFSGAVWTTRPHFQVLTPTLPLFCHHTDTNMRESLARHFGAFKAAIWSLEQCYNTLKNPALLENLDPQFPDPRTYHVLQTNTTVNFKYIHQIDENKLLFIGETDNGEKICIKFVRRYSRAVHEKCAEMGIAPKLRGFEDIGAGWKMVIMDALDEEYKPFDENILPADIREHIRARLVELHQANFVHGDVRDVNMMVRRDGKPGFMLVDFDWSGIIGQARYPININKVDLWRPDDVSDGLLIKPDHDMAMLEHIFNCMCTAG